ncbi:MAG: transcriptional regulator, GntR family [Microvirga sp.]|jgi:DNA-binding GntR family transcriptional regulator|nr:transcriptional regulator, GntR family [Microvirga sp.]
MKRVKNSVPLVETAFQRLRQEIQDGRLQPGTRVVEQEVAERLEMSRTPIREAMRRLEEVGLIMQAPHRGLVVGSLDPQAVNELYEMREGLEGIAAEMSARHASDAERQVMQQLLEREPSLPNEPNVLAEHNRALHDTIYRASHNRYLLRTLGGLRDAMALLGPTTFTVEGRRAAAHEQHRAIVGAIAAGDAAAAGEAARAHIRSAHVIRVGMLTEQGVTRIDLI